jgi:hypothetical protein
MTMKRYGWINIGNISQEHYETGTGDVRKRSAQLRKAGYKVVSEASDQVTSVGIVTMTCLSIFPGQHNDTWSIPEEGITDVPL